jgi:hypothetical protein
MSNYQKSNHQHLNTQPSARRYKGAFLANLADRSAWCTFACNGFGNERALIECKGSHFERDVILWAVRWYVAYPISYRQLEQMMEEHGVELDHAKLDRWVLKYVPRKFATEPLEASNGDI